MSALDISSSLLHRHRQGQKVQGQVHKVKWKLCTKTSNICQNRHPIVEIYPSYRKSRSPEQTAWSVFYRELLNCRFCACVVNHVKKSQPLTMLPKFCFPYRKLRLLNKMVTADVTCRPETELTLFLRMRAKEIAKSLGKCIPIEELLPYYRKSRLPERMSGSAFWSEALYTCIAVSAHAQFK